MQVVVNDYGRFDIVDCYLEFWIEYSTCCQGLRFEQISLFVYLNEISRCPNGKTLRVVGGAHRNTVISLTSSTHGIYLAFGLIEISLLFIEQGHEILTRDIEELKEVLRPEFLSEDDTLQKLLKIFNSLQKKFVSVC